MAARHYIADAMPLLLLLSAILSALTGAVTGARAEAPQRVVSSVVAVAHSESRSVVAVTRRPLNGLPSLAALTFAPRDVMAIVPSLPAFASRRRE